MIALRVDVCCKHCGRFLDAEDSMLAERIGLDADECVDQVRCLDETPLVGFTAAELNAAADGLSQLRDWLRQREADRIQAFFDSIRDDRNADAALTGADLFSREVRTSSALW